MTIARTPPPEWAVSKDAEAKAAGLEALAAAIRTGQIQVHGHPIEYLFCPGGPEAVRAEAARHGLNVDDNPARTRARMNFGPGVAYILYAQKPGNTP